MAQRYILQCPLAVHNLTNIKLGSLHNSTCKMLSAARIHSDGQRTAFANVSFSQINQIALRLLSLQGANFSSSYPLLMIQFVSISPKLVPGEPGPDSRDASAKLLEALSQALAPQPCTDSRHTHTCGCNADITSAAEARCAHSRADEDGHENNGKPLRPDTRAPCSARHFVKSDASRTTTVESGAQR